MSSPEFVTSPLNQFELYTLSPEEMRLAEVIRPSDAFQAAQEPRIAAALAAAQETSVTAEEHYAVTLAADVLRWQFFAKTGDPLPPGLTLSDCYTLPGIQNIQCDPYQGLGMNQYMAARQTLIECGLDEVSDAVSNDLAGRKLEITNQLTAVLTTSDAYRLLSSFNLQKPAAPTEVPLDKARRSARRGEIHKAFDGETLENALPQSAVQAAHWFAGKQLLQRGLSRLDGETMQQPAPQSEDALKRARRFFAPIVAKKWLSGPNIDYTSQINALVNYDPRSGKPAPAALSSLQILEAPDILRGINPDNDFNARQLAIDGSLLRYFVRKIFTAVPTDSYDNILEISTRLTVNQLFGNLLGTPYRQYDLLMHPLLSDIMAAPKGPYLSGEKIHENSANHTAGFITKDKLEKDSATIIGRVEYGNPGTTRVITLQPKTDTLPPHPSGVSLVINLDHADYEHFDPYLPGYHLISREGNQYGFIESDRDPYEPASVPLSLERQALLLPEYAQIDFDAITRYLGDPNLTLEQLIRAIQHHTRYPYPKTVIPSGFSEGALPHSFTPRQFRDFKPLIRDNKLVAQCSISAEFVKMSIDTMFGEGLARIVSGHTVSPSGIITAATHAQLAFRSPDGIYQIYETAASGSGFAPMPGTLRERAAFWWGRRQLRRAIKAAPVETRPETTKKSASANGEEIQIERRKFLLGELALSFEQQLGIVLAARNRDDLFKHIVNLPPGVDPVRRTMELVLRTKSGETTPEQVAELDRYLKVYSRTSPFERDRVGVESYGDDLIDLLTVTTRGLAFYFRMNLEAAKSTK